MVAQVKAMHEEGVAGSVKHYPGHGNTATDSHHEFPMVNDEVELGDRLICHRLPLRLRLVPMWS